MAAPSPCRAGLRLQLPTGLNDLAFGVAEPRLDARAFRAVVQDAPCGLALHSSLDRPTNRPRRKSAAFANFSLSPQHTTGLGREPGYRFCREVGGQCQHIA